MSKLQPFRLIATTVLAGALVLGSLTGCRPATSSAAAAAPSPAATVTATPTPTPAPVFTAKVGKKTATTSTVPGGARLKISASHTPITEATVTDASGDEVAGTVRDGRWVSTKLVPPHATLRWNATAAGGATAAGTVRTAAAARVQSASTNIGDGQVVGVAAPIIVTFAGPVKNKAAVERALKVTTPGHDGDVVGSWGWEGDSQVHYRTKEYWPANTRVHVTMPLADVDEGDGVYGAKDISLDFRIGRSQVVKADATSHRIKIVRAGKVVAVYKASYGMDSVADRTTRSGIHVVSEKHEKVQMVSQRWHYSDTEYWAVRISNNGEFIHANPATTGAQGSANVSHGCINLSMADAKAYFQTAIYGDPVEVTGTKVPLTHDMSDIYDWALTWSQWKARSALN